MNNDDQDFMIGLGGPKRRTPKASIAATLTVECEPMEEQHALQLAERIIANLQNDGFNIVPGGSA